ncbi:MAG: hypothetical protein ACRD43_10305, partial [Pyrinomonadaceae bacterium]
GLAWLGNYGMSYGLLFSLPAFSIIALVIYTRFARSRSDLSILLGLAVGVLLTLIEPLLISIFDRPQFGWIPKITICLLGIVIGFYLWRFSSRLQPSVLS